MVGRSRLLKVRIRLSLLALLAGALAVTGIAPAQQVRAQRELISQERTKLTALSDRNAELEARLARTQDPAYMEKLAREQLGLVRPGESAYVILPGRQIEAPKPAPAAGESWWSRFAGWFGDVFKF